MDALTKSLLTEHLNTLGFLKINSNLNKEEKKYLEEKEKELKSRMESRKEPMSQNSSDFKYQLSRLTNEELSILIAIFFSTLEKKEENSIYNEFKYLVEGRLNNSPALLSGTIGQLFMANKTQWIELLTSSGGCLSAFLKLLEARMKGTLQEPQYKAQPYDPAKVRRQEKEKTLPNNTAITEGKPEIKDEIIHHKPLHHVDKKAQDPVEKTPEENEVERIRRLIKEQHKRANGKPNG